jgi:hypothetical protein
MPWFAPQPAKQGAQKKCRVEPIRLGAAVLPRNRHAARVNNIRLDPARHEPSGQPEAIAPSLIGHHGATDLPPGCGSLPPPSLNQPQKRSLVRIQLLERPPLNTGHDARHEP